MQFILFSRGRTAAWCRRLALLAAFAGLLPPAAPAQLVVTSQVRQVSADAYARDAEVSLTQPQAASNASGFGFFIAAVSNRAVQVNAIGFSEAGQRSEITAYLIAATGRMAAAATAPGPNSENASSAAASLVDLVFVVTNRQAWSLQGSVAASTVAGTLTARVALRDAVTAANLYQYDASSSVPQALNASGTLAPGSYRLLVDFRNQTAPVSNVGLPTDSGGGNYDVRLRVAPAALFTQVTSDTNGLLAAWQAVSGASYRLQFTDPTGPGTIWSNIGAAVVATNASVSAQDTNPAAGRLYRVVPVP